MRMKTILVTLVITASATLAYGQFSCTPKVPSDICQAAESGANVATASQKNLSVVVADPASFTLEKNQLESAAAVRCETALKAGIPKMISRCRGQASYGVHSGVLLETTPDGSLQKIVISTEYFRAIDRTRTRFIKQADGTTKVEMGYAEPDAPTTFEKMNQIGFFVLGYNSGQLNYMADNL